MSAPLYLLAQSVSLFGVVERIEPLLSAAMTIGVFCLASAMACACRCLWSQARHWKWSGTACCIAAGILMGWVRNVDLELITAGNFLFMAAIPVITLWIGNLKEKRARNGVWDIKKPQAVVCQENYQKIEKKVLTKVFLCSIMWKLLREKRRSQKNRKKNLKKVLDKRLKLCYYKWVPRWVRKSDEAGS